MDAGVVSGTLRPAPDRGSDVCEFHGIQAGAGHSSTEGRPPAVENAGSAGVYVPATLRVTAAQAHLRRHRSSVM
ncbi:MAG TPA: hypothetical protein VMT25_07760, partial [Thermoanaerobaculia bacterium]|nr:hypothetical protein [Thermoanaerobaculia bacterium]